MSEPVRARVGRRATACPASARPAYRGPHPRVHGHEPFERVRRGRAGTDLSLEASSAPLSQNRESD
jgi:hypothetical protein